MKISIVVIKLLLLGALFIASNNELYLSDVHDRVVFFNYYYSWLENLFNQGADLTAYVVKSEWLPKSKNSSLIFRAG